MCVHQVDDGLSQINSSGQVWRRDIQGYSAQSTDPWGYVQADNDDDNKNHNDNRTDHNDNITGLYNDDHTVLCTPAAWHASTNWIFR